MNHLILLPKPLLVTFNAEESCTYFQVLGVKYVFAINLCDLVFNWTIIFIEDPIGNEFFINTTIFYIPSVLLEQ